MFFCKSTTLFVVLILLATTTVSQTASDTASIIGTVNRRIPIPQPTKPEPPEINTQTVSKKGTGTRSIPKPTPTKAEPPLSNRQTDFDRGIADRSIVKDNSKKSQSAGSNSSATEPVENDMVNAIESETDKAYNYSLIAYYNAMERKNLADAKTIDLVASYHTWALKNRQRIISRQQLTGSIIFVLVTILLLSGLLFSAIQFRIAIKSAQNKSVAPSDTTFKASLGGIEVSSSILGVIILAISFAFFYLYLTNVYPLVSLDQLPLGMPAQ
jgi:hypothetical protein